MMIMKMNGSVISCIWFDAFMKISWSDVWCLCFWQWSNSVDVWCVCAIAWKKWVRTQPAGGKRRGAIRWHSKKVPWQWVWYPPKKINLKLPKKLELWNFPFQLFVFGSFVLTSHKWNGSRIWFWRTLKIVRFIQPPLHLRTREMNRLLLRGTQIRKLKITPLKWNMLTFRFWGCEGVWKAHYKIMASFLQFSIQKWAGLLQFFSQQKKIKKQSKKHRHEILWV